MNKMTNTHDADKRAERLNEGKASHHFGPLARFWAIALLLVLGAALLPSHSAFARGVEGRKSAARAHKSNAARARTIQRRVQKRAEGATVTPNRITLKAGYKFDRRPDGTIVVARKKGSVTTVEAKCVCGKAGPEGGRTCNVSTQGTDVISCVPSDCGSCQFKTVIITRGGVYAQE